MCLDLRFEENEYQIPCFEQYALKYNIRKFNKVEISRLGRPKICVLKQMKIMTHLRKSRRTEIVGGFRLWIPIYVAT